MTRSLALIILFLVFITPQVLADDRLSAGEMRKAVIGNWSGTWKSSSLQLSIAADGSVSGRYAGISASGSWTTKRAHDGDRFCLTIRAMILSDTKCGELLRRGNNVLYGYLNRGKPRLWLKRS
jgi:hypothetical protein